MPPPCRADISPAPLAAYRCNIHASKVEELGLVNLTAKNGIDYWGGHPMVGSNGEPRSQYFKIVLSGCRSGEILSFYLFMPQELSPQRKEGFRFEEVPVEELTVPYHDLDSRVTDLIKHSFDRMPWRLYLHKEYPYWSKGRVTLSGDAAHPMLPNQSQGAVQAIEDAAALGIIFSKRYAYTSDIPSGLRLYEKIRKPRATRVQAASIRATEDINERIGFSSTPYSQGKHASTGVLTIDEMNLVSAAML
jgi:salicylate hydroxylase